MSLMILIFIVGLCFLASQKQQTFEENSLSLDDLFKKWGQINNIDWKLLKAIAKTESSLNPNATGDDGNSIGLMQVQFLIGQAYSEINDINQLYNPDINLQAASGFLKHLLDRFDLNGAIQAYNLGETRYLRGFRSISYMNKVLNYYYSI